MVPLPEVTRRPPARLFSALLALLLVVSMCGRSGHAAAYSGAGATAVKPVGWEYSGFSLPAWSENELYDSGPALEQLASTGANTVTFVVAWYMTSPVDNSLAPRAGLSGKTPSDASLAWAMDRADALGLRVALMPLVGLDDGGWRAFVAPTEPDRWFASYGAMLGHYAELGRRHHATTLSIGSELLLLSTNPQHEGRWRRLIAQVRGQFGGKLTYSANWGAGEYEEFTRIPFWDALDFIGISAYFDLAPIGGAAPTVDELTARWANWRTTKIAPLQRRWNKPIVFTEVGYRSVDGTAAAPWDYGAARASDPQAQADCYEALFRAWADVPWFAGVAFWHWGSSVTTSPVDAGYEILHKPAQATVTTWFGGRGAAAALPRYCFVETGYCVWDPFLAFWREHGGLALNGFPISNGRVETLQDGRRYLVQYFERTRLEYHPENGPAYDILLGQFGRRIHPDDSPVARQPGAGYFPETGHNLSGPFRTYWEANGGLIQFGYPISEPFFEQLEDGKAYQVQYFERARFEHHPQNTAPYTVLLGQFGRKILGDGATTPPR